MSDDDEKFKIATMIILALKNGKPFTDKKIYAMFPDVRWQRVFPVLHGLATAAFIIKPEGTRSFVMPERVRELFVGDIAARLDALTDGK